MPGDGAPTDGMDLALALGKGDGFGRAPSDYRREKIDRFLGAFRKCVEKHPAGSLSPSFFSFLSEEEARRLCGIGKEKVLKPGQRIYARGDRATDFGFVLQGALVMSEMQDLRIRPQTSATRPHTRAATAPAPDETHVLTEGDTFGEIPLALDGQIVGGLRESTLHTDDDPTVEPMVFVVDYQKFAAFMNELPRRPAIAAVQQPLNEAPHAMASRLLSKVLPKAHHTPPWLTGSKAPQDDVSIAASDQSLPNKKRTKILDSPPVTMVNMDVLMECTWMLKRAQGAVETARAIIGNEARIPHTVVFHDGDIVQWYFGWLTGLKRRGKEHLTSWAVLEEMCKGADAGQTVAMMTCYKRGNSAGKEHVQCRLLDRRRLESVLTGAKSNQLTGYIQKYQRMEKLASSTEYVLQCCWSTASFTADWVPEERAECLTHVHRPARMDPGGNKKLADKMKAQYHDYVPGTLSSLGDHFNSQVIKVNPLEQLDGKTKARLRQFNHGTDTKGGSIVERNIRDSVKTACQQMAAAIDKMVNKSETAREKAIADAHAFRSSHSPSFTVMRTMNCFFKISKDGQPHLLHCTAAVAHPETKPPLNEVAKSELLNPTEECFLFFAGYGAEHSRLSGLGERGVLLDFSEFLQLLTKKELLYDHVSITDASICFKMACQSHSAEDGQLKFPDYCTLMAILRAKLGLDAQGKTNLEAKLEAAAQQQRNERSNLLTATSGGAVAGPGDCDIDQRMVGVLHVRRQQEKERARLGGMFAASIVEKEAIRAVERRAAERDRKHEKRSEERRRKEEARAELERKAIEEHRQKALEKASKKQDEVEQNALRSLEKIEATNRKVMQAREREKQRIIAEKEIRRQGTIAQLKIRRHAEEHRLDEISKRSRLLEDQRAKVTTKLKAVKDSTRDYKHLAVREKEVVRDMFYEYIRTGHMSKPWSLDDLSGDALPALIEIATHKSKGDATALVTTDKGPRQRSRSSLH